MSTNLSKYLRRKTRAMPSFVICAIRYDLKSLEYHIDYCVARDYTPYKYHYHWFNGNPLMHSYLSTWLGYHALDTTFYSYDEKEGEFFSENPAPKQLGQFDFRIFCRNAEKYIIEARPRMKSLLRSMRRVEKTDYLRYLNIFVDGGIYSDADVELVMPIKWWLTTFGFAAYKIDELDFVIGLEFAHPMNYLNNRTNITTTIPFQFCQWCFVGKKGSYLFQKVVEGIEQNIIDAAQASFFQNEVMLKTGPAAFTKIILDELAAHSFPQGKDEKGIPLSLVGSLDHFFSNGKIIELNVNGSTIVGILLPQSAFGSHLQVILDPHQEKVLVSHKFFGGWKNAYHLIEPSSFDN